MDNGSVDVSPIVSVTVNGGSMPTVSDVPHSDHAATAPFVRTRNATLVPLAAVYTMELADVLPLATVAHAPPSMLACTSYALCTEPSALLYVHCMSNSLPSATYAGNVAIVGFAGVRPDVYETMTLHAPFVSVVVPRTAKYHVPDAMDAL